LVPAPGSKEVEGGNVDVDADHDFVLLDTDYTAITADEILKSASNKIAAHVRRTSNRQLLQLNVTHVLKTLKDESVVLDRKGSKVQLPVLRIRMNSGNLSGIEVLMDTITKCADRVANADGKGGSGLLMTAIKGTYTKHTPARRLLLGKTYRTLAQMFPDTLEVLQVELTDEDKKRQTQVINLACRPKGFNEAVNGTHDPIDINRWIDVDVDIETHFYQAFMRRNHIYTAPPSFPICTTWQGTAGRKYPEWYLAGPEETTISSVVVDGKKVGPSVDDPLVD
jgi:hypothetical protein